MNLRSNPRSWTWISDFLKAAESAPPEFKPTDDEILAYIAGLVGEVLAREFWLHRTRQTNGTMTAIDVLDQYRAAHRHVVLDFISSKRLADLVHLSDLVVDHLSDEAQQRDALRNANQCANLATFINDLPSDVRNGLYARIPALKAAL